MAPTPGESAIEHSLDAETPTEATDEPSVDAADRLEAEDQSSVTVADSAARRVQELVDIEDTHAPSEVKPARFPSPTVDSSRGSEALVSEETITIWRPVRRTRSPRVQQRAKTGSPPAPAPQSSEKRVRSESPVLRPEHGRGKWAPLDRPALERNFGTRASPGVGRPESQRFDDKSRQSAAPHPKAGSRSQRPAAAIDSNSPFAKLLELRSLLETQGKNRQ